MDQTELVNHTIKLLPTYSDEQLVHYYKCCLTKQLASEKKLYAPLVTAIEKERKSRGAKLLAEKAEQPISQTADMYEGVANEY